MIDTILGSKIKMSQTFVDNTRVPVTLIKAGPCLVTQIKNQKKDGYWAVQLGFGEKKIKNVTKPMQGHLKGAIKNKLAPRFLSEAKLSEEPKFKVGDEIKASEIFGPGDLVSVTGISKGKGFAGVIKRWGFKGGPRTHGQSDRERAPGSIGQGTTPGRVHKGKKMPGRMGSQQVTIKNLKVISIDVDKDEIVISGPVPGPSKSLLIIKKLKAAEKGKKTKRLDKQEPKKAKAEPESRDEEKEQPGETGGKGEEKKK
jgi:large subunit ribosomal protein L3